MLIPSVNMENRLLTQRFPQNEGTSRIQTLQKNAQVVQKARDKKIYHGHVQQISQQQGLRSGGRYICFSNNNSQEKNKLYELWF